MWTSIDSHVTVRVCIPARDAGTASATRDLDETCITKVFAPAVLNLPVRPMVLVYTIADYGYCVIDLLAHASIRAQKRESIMIRNVCILQYVCSSIKYVRACSASEVRRGGARACTRYAYRRSRAYILDLVPVPV